MKNPMFLIFTPAFLHMSCFWFVDVLRPCVYLLLLTEPLQKQKQKQNFVMLMLLFLLYLLHSDKTYQYFI